MRGATFEKASWAQDEGARQTKNSISEALVDQKWSISWRALVKMRGPCAEWGSSAVLGGVLTVFTRDDPSLPGITLPKVCYKPCCSYCALCKSCVGISSVQSRKERSIWSILIGRRSLCTTYLRTRYFQCRRLTQVACPTFSLQLCSMDLDLKKDRGIK